MHNILFLPQSRYIVNVDRIIKLQNERFETEKTDKTYK